MASYRARQSMGNAAGGALSNYSDSKAQAEQNI
jgi:hypothetical protein